MTANTTTTENENPPAQTDNSRTSRQAASQRVCWGLVHRMRNPCRRQFCGADRIEVRE